MSTAEPPHAGSEHLLVLPDRRRAEEIADALRSEGFEHVRVLREAPRGRGHGAGGADAGWGVHVLDTRLPDAPGGGAYEGLRERFVDLAREHDGWYDQPGDERPATG
ncbi:hypothetical protein [Ornithinimicrobium avium]|uniref:Uncharacterized protein n=1 Tax=Ornithinimicrobium avium TaxID=2283195 RepID=A0A345NPW6_9MICO|nr:hypothetical protein [Ornithinimicrobium avium]AXH97074.1 hypothetical protein DV701_13975 [Ornithinimicrobium avium]